MKLEALDLVKSYGPDSPGRETRRLVDRHGIMRLGSGLWATGQHAIDVLDETIMERGDEGLRELAESIPAWIREGTTFLDGEFFATLSEARLAGVLQFRAEGERGDSEEFDLPEAWAAYEFPDKVELFTQMIGGRLDVLRAVPDFVSIVQCFTAVAVLVWLDDALIADFCDGRGLDDVVAGIEKLRSHLDAPVNALAMIDAVIAKAKTDNAKAGAAARHKDNYADKEHVFNYLDANPPMPRGKDAAAMAIIEEHQVSVAFRTVRKWIDEWEKQRAASRM